MEIVIDAQIVKGYYEETVLGNDVVAKGDLTSLPSVLFARVGVEDICFLDNIIEHEWRSLVEREWFEAWYGQLLIDGFVQIVPRTQSKEIENKLRDLGFPPSRDKCYIRVCQTILAKKIAKHSILISEDLDFHDPTRKCGSSITRMKLLADGNGSICKTLKRYCIHVVALCNYP